MHLLMWFFLTSRNIFWDHAFWQFVWHILYRKILDNNYVVENSETDCCLQWKCFVLRLEKENNRNNIHLNFFFLIISCMLLLKDF